MEDFYWVLLIIIAVLLLLDVLFLIKMSKSDINRTRNLSDERYAELKVRQRILEIAAALVLFVGTFLGVSTIDSIKNEYKKQLDNEVKSLRDDVKKIDGMLEHYSSSVDFLKNIETDAVENLGDINREFGLIKEKLHQNEKALKHTPQIYVVEKLKYSLSMAVARSGRNAITWRVNYDTLKTIYGESLPKFKRPPLINVQGQGRDFLITENTSEYFELYLLEPNPKGLSPDITEFDIWVVPLN